MYLFESQNYREETRIRERERHLPSTSSLLQRLGLSNLKPGDQNSIQASQEKSIFIAFPDTITGSWTGQWDSQVSNKRLYGMAAWLTAPQCWTLVLTIYPIWPNQNTATAYFTMFMENGTKGQTNFGAKSIWRVSIVAQWVKATAYNSRSQS